MAPDLEEIGRPPGGEEAQGSYSELLKGLLDRERDPALHRALDAGIFDDDADPDAEFRFGLERVLDGIGAAGGPSGRAASPAERASS